MPDTTTTVPVTPARQLRQDNRAINEMLEGIEHRLGDYTLTELLAGDTKWLHISKASVNGAEAAKDWLADTVAAVREWFVDDRGVPFSTPSYAGVRWVYRGVQVDVMVRRECFPVPVTDVTDLVAEVVG